MRRTAALAILIVALVCSNWRGPCTGQASPALAHRCSCCPTDTPCGCCTSQPAPAEHERGGQLPVHPRFVVPAPEEAPVGLVTRALPLAAAPSKPERPLPPYSAPPVFVLGQAFRC